MKMAAKSSTRAKTAVKPAKKVSAATAVKKAAAVKPVKKAVKQKPLTKSEKDWLKRNRVPLAEVEVLAAAAVKMIKAKRSASPEEKARKLDMVADKLEKAKGWGGLSKSGAWVLKHPFGICQIIDLEAVLSGASALP
jgi:hypothetical protein